MLKLLGDRWSLPGRVGRKEIAVLGAILASAGALYAVIKLASVLAGAANAFDRFFLISLRNPADFADPIGPLWVKIAMKDLTSLGSTTVLTLVTLAAVGYLLIARKRAAAMLVVASVGGGMLLSNLLKTVVARPRPDLVAHSVDVYTASFPSSHAMLSAITYLTLGALLARVESNVRTKAYLLGLAIALTLSIGISRVYLGVHYPTDVLAGWTVGAAWAIGCWRLAWWLQRQGAVEPDRAGQGSGAAG